MTKLKAPSHLASKPDHSSKIDDALELKMADSVDSSFVSNRNAFPYIAAGFLSGLVWALFFGLVDKRLIFEFLDAGVSGITYPIATLAIFGVNAAFAFCNKRLFIWLAATQALALIALWGLAPVLIVVVVLLAYEIVGYFLMRQFAIAPDYAQSPILALVVGIIVFGWVLQGAAFLPIHNVFFYCLALITVLYFGRKQIRIWVNSTSGHLRFWIGSEDRITRLVVSLALSAVFVFAYLTRIPEMGTDALMTHLAITNQIVRDGRFIPDISTLAWAYIQKPMHFAYLPVHILVGEYGLRLMHVSLGLLAVTAVAIGIARAGAPRAGWVMAAFLVSSPLMLQENASIFVENYLSLLSVIATLALVRLWKDGFPLKQALLVGFLFGGVAAAKLHGLIFAPLIALVFAAGIFADHCSRGRLIATGAAAMVYLVVAAPSYLVPWIATGNPVFPFFNDFFLAPQFSTEAFSFPFERPPVNIFMWLNMAIDGSPYLEAGGPVSMFHIYFFGPLVLIGLVVWRRVEFIIPAVLGLGHVVLVIVAQNYLRYHTAGFFVLSLAAGLAMAWLWKAHISRLVLIVVGAVIIVGNVFYAVQGSYLYRGMMVWELGTKEGQARIENWRAPEREMVRVADALLGPDERVAIFWHPYIGLSKNYMLPMHPFFGYVAWRSFEEAMMMDNPVPFFNKYQITHVIIRDGMQFKGAGKLIEWLSQHGRVVKSENGSALYAISTEHLFNGTVIESTSVANWEQSGTPTLLSTGNLLVSGPNLALKFFDTQAGEFLQIHLRARCVKGTTAWLHINWYTAQGIYLHPTIVNRQCTTDMSDYLASFLVPEGADRGAIILDTLPDVQMEIATVSLMKKVTMR